MQQKVVLRRKIQAYLKPKQNKTKQNKTKKKPQINHLIIHLKEL